MAHLLEQDEDYKDKLSFIGNWYDYDVSFHKNFIVNFFTCDNTVELYDTDLHRIYLKRVKCDGLDLKDMFIGNTIRVYGRQIQLTDYNDCKTKSRIGKATEHTLALIKPSAVDRLGEVITHILKEQFMISNLLMCQVSRKEALEFYDSKKGDSFLAFMVEHLVSGPIVAFELIGYDAINRWRAIMGPTDPLEARKTAPESLRALYGKELASNGFYGPDTHEQAVKDACFFFPKGVNRSTPPSTAQIQNSTCCVVKPHALHEGKFGFIVTDIMSKFKITAMRMYNLSNANADEYLEVYKGIVPDFHAFMLSFLDGPCVVLEISGKGEGVNVHEEFRKFCGPSDSDIARQIRPYTLRGKYGVDKYKNAVHCTDLPDDTQLELEYFFKILY